MNVALCASEIYGAVKNGDGRPLSALTAEESIAYLKVDQDRSMVDTDADIQHSLCTHLFSWPNWL